MAWVVINYTFRFYCHLNHKTISLKKKKNIDGMMIMLDSTEFGCSSHWYGCKGQRNKTQINPAQILIRVKKKKYKQTNGPHCWYR